MGILWLNFLATTLSFSLEIPLTSLLGTCRIYQVFLGFILRMLRVVKGNLKEVVET